MYVYLCACIYTYKFYTSIYNKTYIICIEIHIYTYHPDLPEMSTSKNKISAMFSEFKTSRIFLSFFG